MERRALGNRAKAAGPRADISKNHERRGATRPAFRSVRAARVLANGFELEVVEQSLCERVSVPGRKRSLQPRWKTAARALWHLRRCIKNVERQHVGLAPGAHRGDCGILIHGR